MEQCLLLTVVHSPGTSFVYIARESQSNLIHFLTEASIKNFKAKLESANYSNLDHELIV